LVFYLGPATPAAELARGGGAHLRRRRWALWLRSPELPWPLWPLVLALNCAFVGPSSGTQTPPRQAPWPPPPARRRPPPRLNFEGITHQCVRGDESTGGGELPPHRPAAATAEPPPAPWRRMRRRAPPLRSHGGGSASSTPTRLWRRRHVRSSALGGWR